MNKSFLRLLPLIGFLLLAFFIANGWLTSAQVKERSSPMIGTLLPSFTLPKAAGKPGELFLPALWKDKVAVISVFASWCKPCAAEQPVLLELAKTPGVNLFGLAWKDSPEGVAAYLQQTGNPYRAVGIDALGQTRLIFGIQGLPETYVIGRDGRVRWKHEGVMTAGDAAQMVELVKKLNAER